MLFGNRTAETFRDSLQRLTYFQKNEKNFNMDLMLLRGIKREKRRSNEKCQYK